MGLAQHGDLLPHHEEVGVLGADERLSRISQPSEDQVEQDEGTRLIIIAYR